MVLPRILAETDLAVVMPSRLADVFQRSWATTRSGGRASVCRRFDVSRCTGSGASPASPATAGCASRSSQLFGEGPGTAPRIMHATATAPLPTTTAVTPTEDTPMDTTERPVAASPAVDRGLAYQSGFGNELATEALPGALPVGQNSPQQRRVRSVRRADVGHRVHRAARAQPPLVALPHPPGRRARAVPSASTTAGSSAASTTCATPPNQLRWDPLPMPQRPTDFVDGLVTMAGNGDLATMSGCASTCTRRTARWRIASSTTPTASC